MYEYSVVLPSHSEGRYLKRTVESVLETAGDAPVEVVVVDDRSDDFSGDELAAEYAADDRVQVIQSLYSLGAGGARSLGADAAVGRTLVFMDSHSEMPRSWPADLRRAQKQVRRPTFFGTVLQPLVYPDREGVTDAPLDAHGIWLDEPSMLENYQVPRDNTDKPYPCMSLPGGCMVVARDLYDELGGFDLGLRPPWGQECLEICLRTWALGYEVRVIPSLAIKTLYKAEAEAVSVRYSSMLYNRLRIAHLYFSRDRIERVIEAMKEDEWFHVAMADYLCNGAVTMWQRAISPRRHPEDIFERFGIDW